MRDVALTTIDNPYDPFDEFDQWYAYDVALGYNTCSYLDRIAITADGNLGLEDEISQIETAIDEIVSMNVLGIYKKLIRETA